MEPGSSSKENGKKLPPPPPFMPLDMKERNDSLPIMPAGKNRVQMARPGLASKGKPITLLTNHFKVSVRNIHEYFFHYNVILKFENDAPVYDKGISMKVIDEMQKIYNTELGNKEFAYDGVNNLFTIGPLPQINNEFTVILNGMLSKILVEGGNKRARLSCKAKSIKVDIRFAAKIPMRSIAMALKGEDNENTREAFRILDIILRQHAAKQGCFLVRQSFFHGNQANCTDLGGGIIACRGFDSSFRPVQSGLSLNVDVSTTMIIRPGPVVDFLIANQNVRDPFHVDWAKAKRMLKNLRVRVRNMEQKIIGLSELKCNEQTFTLKPRGGGDNGIEITVYDYFVMHLGVPLSYSSRLPCIKVGKPKRPAYFPIELCNLVSLQRYRKELTVQQKASFVEKSRQKPQEKMSYITNGLKHAKYDTDPMLQLCGISINTNFTQVQGRVLEPPKLIVGNGVDLIPRNGRWNFNSKKFYDSAEVKSWAVVNFSARCDTNGLIRNLISCGDIKGILIEQPLIVLEENPSMRTATPPARVEAMFDQLCPGLKFLLCLLPDRRNAGIYGPWKRKCLAEFGIATQCMAPTRVNDQILTNLLMKINSKLGGMNSVLQLEYNFAFPVISKVATMILGMDVSHGSAGISDVPSIAAVVSSRQWPFISIYRASVRSQSPKLEMIDSLFKPSSGTDHNGIYDQGSIREALLDFFISSGKRKPDQIIIFRDGVSEYQFNQILNVELEQIIQACKFLDDQWFPKFTLVIAQKRHRTKFFLAGGSPENVPPGTVVDKQICHPRNYDFYMCPHAGFIGTSRPIHYHVLLDENDLNPDDFQELVHSLSYVYQRSTTAISVVAPIYYAHLAASQVGQFIKYNEWSETSSSEGKMTTHRVVPVPKLPKLHPNLRTSMFFC